MRWVFRRNTCLSNVKVGFYVDRNCNNWLCNFTDLAVTLNFGKFMEDLLLDCEIIARFIIEY